MVKGRQRQATSNILPGCFSFRALKYSKCIVQLLTSGSYDKGEKTLNPNVSKRELAHGTVKAASDKRRTSNILPGCFSFRAPKCSKWIVQLFTSSSAPTTDNCGYYLHLFCFSASGKRQALLLIISLLDKDAPMAEEATVGGATRGLWPTRSNHHLGSRATSKEIGYTTRSYNSNI